MHPSRSIMIMFVKVINQFYTLKCFKVIIHSLYIKSMSSQNYTHFTDKELDLEKKKHPYINLEQEYVFMVL